MPLIYASFILWSVLAVIDFLIGYYSSAIMDISMVLVSASLCKWLGGKNPAEKKSPDLQLEDEELTLTKMFKK